MTQPLDPLAFLNLAQELASQGNDETKIRTAVGRAYYALFLVAREKTGVRGRRNVHQLVIDGVRGRTGYRPIGDQLDTLRRLRSVADYQLLPDKTADRDWMRNWSRVDEIVKRILPRLSSW